MPKETISYQESGYFSKIVTDYLNRKSSLKDLYNLYPTIENFNLQIQEKAKEFSSINRKILTEELIHQYKIQNISKETLNNINLLKNQNTFTITTGHQLNLFTGPLYFIYKIVSVINLCKQLKSYYANYNFVPVYWMATEDHDFAEINNFEYNHKKLIWKSNTNGAVGSISTNGLEDVYNILQKLFPENNASDYLKTLFKNSYLSNTNLAEATRTLVNSLFSSEGLVIIDANKKNLKQLFTNTIKKELLNQTTFKCVNNTNILLKDYETQVNAREINLFYLDENVRERIVYENHNFRVLHTNLTFTEEEILEILKNNPEKLSPNVLLRPLYQETILPNICYIGGGAEVAYWLQLKSTFAANNITFPIILLRNSALIITKKQQEKIEKLNLSLSELFLPKQELINKKTKEYSSQNLDFTALKNHLHNQFKKLYDVANETGASFLGALKAQEAKQIKGLEKLEKKLFNAEKKLHSDKLLRIINLHNELFPNETLQERKVNFSEFYASYGNDFFSELYKNFNPLEHNFSIITLS